MHLADVLELRTRPAAGLLLALTQRCPLRCAHCSTESEMSAAQHSERPFRRLVGTFTRQHRPKVIFMSGGEPLLRPGLVADLAESARTVGTRTMLLSGMFFAREHRIPSPIRRAIAAVDHLSASIDEFHEREVPRERVLRALSKVLDLTGAASVHLSSNSHEYIDSVIADLRRAFGERVPVLVTRVQPVGRAREGVTALKHGIDFGACEFAGWPLVDYDGRIFACSRQSLVRQHMPEHLVLGDASVDAWPDIQQRCVTSAALRSIRAIGPIAIAAQVGIATSQNACLTCVGLRAVPAQSPAVELLGAKLAERMSPRDLARRWGGAAHADLVEAGWQRELSEMER